MVKIFFLSQQTLHGSLSWVWALGSLLSSFSFILFSTSRRSLKHVYKMRLYSIPYSLVPWRLQFIESNKTRSSKRILLNRLWALLCYLVTDIHLPGNCCLIQHRHESLSCLPGALTPRVLKSRSLNSKIVITYNCLRGEADCILPDAPRVHTRVKWFPYPHPAPVMQWAVHKREEGAKRSSLCWLQLQAGCKVTPVSKGARALNPN